MHHQVGYLQKSWGNRHLALQVIHSQEETGSPVGGPWFLDAGGHVLTRTVTAQQRLNTKKRAAPPRLCGILRSELPESAVGFAAGGSSQRLSPTEL